MNPEFIAKNVVDAASEIHQELGPGLLESAYKACLNYELTERGFFVEVEKPLPLQYKNQYLECGYRIDLLINNQVLLELKTVDSLQPVHSAQILTYLRLSNKKLGFLINFNVRLFKQGIKRFVLNYERPDC